MLKINALKINLNTDKGLYGINLKFEDGLNVIRGDNSAGKSTIFQSILYALGMEELIGGKNDKAMQSVLKNEVLNDQKVKEATVLESHILLEVTNGKDTITTERYIKSENRDPRLIKVFYKPMLTQVHSEVISDPMYLHDAGSATDVKFGFFAYLEKFLGYNLPEVIYADGNLRKLYLQNIFPAFIVEQKVGWSDFLATIPFYNLKEKERRAIEFILKLDSWNIEERKQGVKTEKHRLENLWQRKIEQLKDLADKSALELKGVDEKPIILNSLSSVYLSYIGKEKVYTLHEYITELENDLKTLENSEIPKIKEIASAKEKELSEANETYSKYSVRYKEILDRRSLISESIESILIRSKQIEEELEQNKHHKKVKQFGAENDIKIAQDICPTCSQPIADSLLPQGTMQMPMTIDENIGYLESQKFIAASYIKAHQSDKLKLDSQVRQIEEILADLRAKIRSIKIDLITDDRLPSVELIERRIRLKTRVEHYHNTRDSFNTLLEQLLSISKEWEDVLIREGKLPKTSFSDSDLDKLKALEKDFISLLKTFGYGSKSLKDIRISKDKLIPVAEGYYSIKFDSSASDLVRAICAYTISLFRVSKSKNGNHPNFIMLDEPGNQETAVSDLKAILSELSKCQAQSLVFASFKQSDTDFNESTQGVKFNLIRASNKKFIQKIS